MARKPPASTPGPGPAPQAAPIPPLQVADALARAGLGALIARLPAEPTAAAIVLRLPDGLVVVPVGVLGDVLEALSSAHELVHRDGVRRAAYSLEVVPPS